MTATLVMVGLMALTLWTVMGFVGRARRRAHPEPGWESDAWRGQVQHAPGRYFGRHRAGAT